MVNELTGVARSRMKHEPQFAGAGIGLQFHKMIAAAKGAELEVRIAAGSFEELELR